MDTRRGQHVDPSKVTVAKQLDAWMRSKAKCLSAKNHGDYRAAIENHVKPALGSHMVQKIVKLVIGRQGATSGLGLTRSVRSYGCTI